MLSVCREWGPSSLSQQALLAEEEAARLKAELAAPEAKVKSALTLEVGRQFVSI